MRKHGPITCLDWTPAGAPSTLLLPCSHGRKAVIIWRTPAKKVSVPVLEHVAVASDEFHQVFKMADGIELILTHQFSCRCCRGPS